jgi:hypothetical protein
MTHELAATELLRRTDAATNLRAFTEYTWPKYETAAIHRIIASQLERIERGEIDRLMLLVPPRHGKSELVDRMTAGTKPKVDREIKRDA